MTPLFRTAVTVAIGAALVLGPGQAAMAADHSARLDAGYATITLDLGADAANATASVLILGSDANVDSPRQSDIVYINELTMGADGTLQFRVLLDGGPLDDYMIASTVAGARHVSPLAEVAGGGGNPRPGGSTGGGTGGGSGVGRTGSGSTGGTDTSEAVGEPAGGLPAEGTGSSGTGGTASGSAGGEPRPSKSAQPQWADWIAPVLTGVGILAAVAGGALLVLRRRRLGGSAQASAEGPAD